MDTKYPYPPTMIYNESVMSCCGSPRTQCTCNKPTENAAGGFAPFGEPAEYVPDEGTQKPNPDSDHVMGALPPPPEPTTEYELTEEEEETRKQYNRYFNKDGSHKPLLYDPDSEEWLPFDQDTSKDSQFAPFGEPQEYIQDCLG